MSQRFLTDPEWAAQYAAERQSDPAEQEKMLRQYRERVSFAIALLERTDVGKTIHFAGNSPAGLTYADPVEWDGTEECRERIAVLAVKHGRNDAWNAWPMAA